MGCPCRDTTHHHYYKCKYHQLYHLHRTCHLYLWNLVRFDFVIKLQSLLALYLQCPKKLNKTHTPQSIKKKTTNAHTYTYTHSTLWLPKVNIYIYTFGFLVQKVILSKCNSCATPFKLQYILDNNYYFDYLFFLMLPFNIECVCSAQRKKGGVHSTRALCTCIIAIQQLQLCTTSMNLSQCIGDNFR